MSGCCILWSLSPDRAPLVVLLPLDPPPLKPVMVAADNTVSLSLLAGSPVFTTKLTVLGTDVVVSALVTAAWAAFVTVDELVEVPAIVAAVLLVLAGEGVFPGRGCGMDGLRGRGREELNCSPFRLVFKPVFKLAFVCNFSLASFSIAISFG